MKRSLSLIIFVLVFLSFGIFSASAESEYSYEGLTFSVPDFMKNDEKWAADADYTYAFSDVDLNIELNIAVYENDGYSYSGLDDESLNAYASSIEDYYIQSGYTVESVDVTDYTLSNGVDGVKVDVSLSNGEIGTFYWFATAEMCYDLEFYIYEQEYAQFVDQIIKTVSIDAQAETPDNGNNDASDEDDTDKTDGASDDATENENKSTEYTVKDLTLTLPGFLNEESIEAQAGGTAKGWASDDSMFFVEVYTSVNDKEEIAADFKDDEFKTLFNNLKSEDSDIKELVSSENIKINGFKGIKLVYSASSFGVPYEINHFFFATKDTVYEILVVSLSEKYDEYVESVIQSVKIDGKALTNTSYYIYVAASVAFAVIGIISRVIKKKKSKNQKYPQGYVGANTTGQPTYFNPQTDAYNPQNMNTQPQGGFGVPTSTPQNINYGDNSGYIENNGYAPDYDYSNKLDRTLDSTNDFSKTEYLRETAGREQMHSHDTEE